MIYNLEEEIMDRKYTEIWVKKAGDARILQVFKQNNVVLY